MTWHHVFAKLIGRSPTPEDISVLAPALKIYADDDPFLEIAIIQLYASGQIRRNDESDPFREGLVNIDNVMQRLRLSLQQWKEEIESLKLIGKEIKDNHQSTQMHSIKTLNFVKYESEKHRDFIGANNLTTSSTVFRVAFSLSFLMLATAILFFAILLYQSKPEPTPIAQLSADQQQKILVLQKNGQLDKILNCKLDGYVNYNGSCFINSPRHMGDFESWSVPH